MNANELADKLVDWYEDYNGRFDLIDEAIAMIRQQQDRLEHLEKMVVWYQDIKMVGQHSEEYENGFWDAVDFVKAHQVKDKN